jgi:hypothetical protein
LANPNFLQVAPKQTALYSSAQDVNNQTSISMDVESTTKTKRQLSRPERKALERQKKLQSPPRPKKSNDLVRSHAVSLLTKDSTLEDVTRAIKRAQNNHDHQELKVIADFLINECDVGFAYGYRGSLLARLAVAALHFENHQVARRAIDIRRLGE